MIAGPLNSVPAPDDFYTFIQDVPLSIWYVAHHLNRDVVVDLLDDTGAVFIADIRHINSREFVVVSNTPVTGKAVVR